MNSSSWIFIKGFVEKKLFLENGSRAAAHARLQLVERESRNVPRCGCERRTPACAVTGARLGGLTVRSHFSRQHLAWLLRLEKSHSMPRECWASGTVLEACVLAWHVACVSGSPHRKDLSPAAAGLRTRFSGL